MKDLYFVAAGHTKRFPDGNEPYKIVTRILEECGEVASEVNHFERSGIKTIKYGEPSKQKLADEIKQAMSCLMQLVQYYKLENEFEKSIEASIERIKGDD